MSVDAVVFSAVAKVQRQLAGFYGDEIAVDYLTHPSRTAEEVDTWLENPDNQARLARVYNSVLGFNRMGQYGYGRLIGSGTALTVLAASTAAVQALSYNTEFRTAILSHDPALINALANSAARDYLLAQHPAELAGWLASTAAATLTTLLDDHMSAMQDVMANPVCAPILMGDPATKNQLINYPALIDAIAATNEGLDAVLNDAAAWQTIVENGTLLTAWLESSRAVARLVENEGAMHSLATSPVAVQAIAYNLEAISLIAGSQVAMNAVASSIPAVEILADNADVQGVFANNSVAMEEFAANESAVDILLASSTARTIILNNPISLKAFFSSMMVRTKIFYDEDVCNELFSNSYTTQWLESNIASSQSAGRASGSRTTNVTNSGSLVFTGFTNSGSVNSKNGQVEDIFPGGGSLDIMGGGIRQTFNVRCKPLIHGYGSFNSNNNNTTNSSNFNYIVMEEE